MIIYGQELTIQSLKPDGQATVFSRVAEIRANGVGLLPEAIQEELRNDPSMADAGAMTFGGYGGHVVEMQIDSLLTREEKLEMKGAIRHWKKSNYAELLARYGTADIHFIKQIIRYRKVGTKMIKGVQGFDRNTGHAVSFLRRDLSSQK